MVVQEQERDEYNYDVEYLVVGNDIGIAKTRKHIYDHAGNTRFCHRNRTPPLDLSRTSRMPPSLPPGSFPDASRTISRTLLELFLDVLPDRLPDVHPVRQ